MARQVVKTDEKPATVITTSNRWNGWHDSRTWLAVLVCLVILFLAFMAGAHANRHRGFVNGPSSYIGGRFGGRRMTGERGFGFGGGETINGQNRVQGVVTSVNGSDFTIAGNGSTTSVMTNSSTQYQGGNQVKQYDTVFVFGTTNNGTVTATEVVINP